MWVWVGYNYSDDQTFSNSLFSGPSKRKDAGTGGEKQSKQWVAVDKEETWGDRKSEGK